MDNYLLAFIAITTIAVLIQAGILVALYVSVRKSSARMEDLASEVRTKMLPVIDTSQSMLTELRPKIEAAVSNVNQSSALVRAQLERVDAAIGDVIDRARLQVIRTDELLSRTLDRVEETTDVMHRTVISPVRQLSGLVQGLTAGLEFLVGGKRRQRNNGMGVPQDEMFI